MKRLFLYTVQLFVLSLLVLQAAAQSGPYGNEWIDYNKTYYKFKVAKAGVYRIPRSVLDAAGLPAGVTGANFMLYRDGLEVPIYVSANTMTGSDYIEFIGRGASGILDKELYANPAWQPDTRICLYTDTAAYYLTYDNGTAHARFTEAVNSIPGTPPAAEPYNWTTVGNYYKAKQTEGPSYDTNPGLPFFSPSFENGEGLVKEQVPVANTATISLAAPNLAGAAVSAILQTAVTSRSYLYNHAMNLAVNGTQVANASWGISETQHFNTSFPASQLGAANTISYIPVNPQGTAYDIYGVSYVELQYPRNYDLNGLSMHQFRLNANNNAQYLEFTNFSNPSRLYDVTNRKWYAGDIQGSTTRFYIQPSLTDRDLVLVATNTGATNVALSKTVQFKNYSATANQGNYLLISHSKLAQPVSGHNYIQEYRDYRASTAGGGYTAQYADVNELYDQFAYGYETHPLSIRHFLQYAYNTWTVKPEYVNIIGRGLQYEEYNSYYAQPDSFYFPIVPIYGSPGSDVNYVNFGTPRTQKIKIGRVSVWNAQEVGQYLEKVKGYEAELNTGSDARALWKKEAIHIAGGSNPQERDALLTTLNMGAAIITDTLIGAHVQTFAKGSTNPVDVIDMQAVESSLNKGLGLISYFGHASAGGFAYNLPEPSTYNSSPRFPIFNALGCDVAQMFGAFTGKTVSERYTLSSTGGAIALLATDNYGYTDFLHNYLQFFYKSISNKHYGADIGTQSMETNNDVFQYYCSNLGITSDRYFTQIECQLLTGDPAVGTYGPSKPDYHVSNDGLSAIPGNVSTALDSFQLRIVSYNLARAIRDTVTVKVEHINPVGTKTTISTYTIPNLFNTDTDYVWVPLNKITDIGLNKYQVTIDEPNKFDEVNELNNQGTLDLFIYSDNLVPVYPHEFAIVNRQNVTLKASTLNPFRPSGRYIMEIDTTALFNSPLKQQTSIASRGGIIKWTPSLIMKDSTVYYWRSAIDSVINGSQQWSGSSFIYLAQGTPGWNQSHYYQYKRDNFSSMDIGPDYLFHYGKQDNILTVRNKVLENDGDGSNVRVEWNGAIVNNSAQGVTTVQIMVIDSVTGQFWTNAFNDTRGSFTPRSDRSRGYNLREFRTDVADLRDSAAKYLESIPNGDYVMIKNIFFDYTSGTLRSQSIYIDQWKADTLRPNNGPGKSLYHSVRNLGFPMIDSFTKEGVFLFFTKKGFPATTHQEWTSDRSARLVYTVTVESNTTKGQMNSTVIGPVNGADTLTLKWRTHAADTHPENDSAYVAVYGINTANKDTLLFNTASKDTSFIAGYPKVRMEWRTRDSLTTTTPQLNYWRVMYDPLPEAALNPAAHFAISDSLQTGQLQQFSVAIENLTDIPMDSMLVNYRVINASGVSVPQASVRYRPLPGLDTLHASLTFDPAGYPGKNNLFIEANPANDQPEQYHPNNLGYVPFSISVDRNNPLLDVTFDGVHILNADIVSAKPFIKVSLKDENKYLALDDTSLVALKLTYTSRDPNVPGTFTVPLPFDGKVCKFIPGQPGISGKNEAIIEMRPVLEDGIYDLSVTGKDKSGNSAGTPQGSGSAVNYKISFEVINKAMITNVLNYPNPFSTATSFVFTVTGSQIPSQFKIQILSVTGKVVREITKNELGPLHIGRNITQYKWDGRDQYGQLLGNGVYMYRVATSLNGEDIEHKSSGADRFFKNGYGKLYIMR